MAGKRVVVGMSGGVDSSVAACLLQDAGYEVIGVTMQTGQDEETEVLEENGGCCGLSAVEDARRVAQKIKIPHYVMNFKREFKEHVIDYFVDAYVKGRTPNPCIACNRFVKWESLLRRSLELGADYIATGHYARIRHLENGRYALQSSVTCEKDQTYALYNLTQDQLAHTLMPVGDYTKDEIRQIAAQAGLPVAQKPDSQEICFVPDGDYAGFIDCSLPEPVPPGDFVNTKGEKIGRHKGITHYTIGQRKGLGLSMGHPVFVAAIRPQSNEVVIGESEDIFAPALLCSHVNHMACEQIEDGTAVTAKIRYNHRGAACRIYKSAGDEICCLFEEPQRAITPGQAVVFYEGDTVLGGGVIERALQETDIDLYIRWSMRDDLMEDDEECRRPAQGRSRYRRRSKPAT